MKVLKIGADWCPECVIMRPRWEEIEKIMPDLQTEYADYDKQTEIKEKYQIDHVPTFIFLDKDGRELHRVRGLAEKDELMEIINRIKDK